MVKLSRDVRRSLFAFILLIHPHYVAVCPLDISGYGLSAELVITRTLAIRILHGLSAELVITRTLAI